MPAVYWFIAARTGTSAALLKGQLAQHFKATVCHVPVRRLLLVSIHLANR